MKILIAILYFIIIDSAHAFNWNECKKGYFDKSTGMGHWIAGVVTSTYGTMEFSTSTGECSMIGIATHDKKVFLAQNFEELKTDSARGGGEYLSAYASLSRCSQSASTQLPKSFQKNFKIIYGERISKEPKEVFEAMEIVIQSDPELALGCNINSSNS